MKRQRIFRLTVALLLSIIYILPATSLALAVPPDNDDFANAQVVSELPYSNFQETIAATTETSEPAPTCATNFGGKTVWYTYTPSASGSLFTYVDSFYIPRVLAVYTGSSLDSLTELGCRTSNDRLAFSAQASTTYHFQVGVLDNYADGGMLFGLGVAGPLLVNFGYSPGDPSLFDTVQFYDNSQDPYDGGIQSQSWNFGDGATATGCCPTHQYAADGNYAVMLAVTTVDGRTSSTTQNVAIVTHDVAITKFTAPNAASAGQTRNIVVGLNSRRYDENVEVRLLKSNPGDPSNPWLTVGTLNQYVPVRASNRTTDFNFSYTFTPNDANIGTVTFKAVANLTTGRDALPADNEVIASPTKVRGKIHAANNSNVEGVEPGVQLFLPMVANE